MRRGSSLTTFSIDVSTDSIASRYRARMPTKSQAPCEKARPRGKPIATPNAARLSVKAATDPGAGPYDGLLCGQDHRAHQRGRDELPTASLKLGMPGIANDYVAVRILRRIRHSNLSVRPARPGENMRNMRLMRRLIGATSSCAQSRHTSTRS